jgi:hypothetical protein
MGSKKYSRKACAYCGRDGVSKTADHVVARQFFLASDRKNSLKVPACEDCNGLKSKLESYVLTVLPLANRHCDAKAYSEENIERRLKRNADVRSQLLSLQHSGLWERQPNGVLVPIIAVDVDQEQIRDLFAFIVKGLFMFHWGVPLNEKWMPDVAIIRPHVEGLVWSKIIGTMGPNLEVVRGNLGRGTFVYAGTRSLTLRWYSLWQFTVFGGLQFGNADTPNQAFTKLSAVTRPDMSRGPFSDEEVGLSNPAAA